MYELEKNESIEKLISITKSDSGISGPKLAMAHMELGKLLAERMPKYYYSRYNAGRNLFCRRFVFCSWV